jgi:hypothetical protein
MKNREKIPQVYKHIPINLHHRKAVMALLCQKFVTGEINTALI